MRIAIRVLTQYEPTLSNVKHHDFFFSYRIFIKNENSFPVQVMYRYWDILDFVSGNRKVEGVGVVGEQPIIIPQGEHSYSSFCFLKYPFGRMKGQYLVKNLQSAKDYKVDIPPFSLCVPYLCN